MIFLVLVERTEQIQFEVEAESAQAAEDAYLADGEEIASRTVCMQVLACEQVDPTR